MSIDTYNPPYLSQVVGTGLSAVRGSRGFTVVHKFGRNAAIGTSWVPVAFGGVYVTPQAAVSLEFVSASANDALNSSGMHELTVIGLDASWAEQTVVTAAHATDGTTAVAISGTWLRVYRAYVSQSGSYPNVGGGSHAAAITVRVASAGATYATIDASGSLPRGQSEIACYTIPTGKTGYVASLSITADVGQTNAPDAVFFQRPNADDTSSSHTGTMRIVWTALQIEGQVTLNPKTPLGPFVGPCDIGLIAEVAASTGTAEADFEILLLDT